MPISAAERSQIVDLYIAWFNRVPDGAGLQYWEGQREAGASFESISAQFYSAALQFSTQTGYSASMDNLAFVTKLYEGVLARTGDLAPNAEEAKYWTDILESNGGDRGALALRMIREAKAFDAQGNTEIQRIIDTLNAKTVVAEYGLEKGLTYPTSTVAISAGKAFLDGVDGSEAKNDEARAEIDAYLALLSSKPTGNTFNLTEEARYFISQLEFNARPGDVGIASVQTEPASIVEAPATLESRDLINLSAFRARPEYAGIDGSGFATVIIDSGIDLDHPFFGPDADKNGISDRIVYTQDFTAEANTANDTNGHGTNVASIAASSDSVYGGMAPGANIIALQALAANGRGPWSGMENALRWVINNAEKYNIASVNLSIGDNTNNTAASALTGLEDEFLALEAMGVIVVTAAGNDYGRFNAQGVAAPGIHAGGIAVGAVYDSNIGNSIGYGGGATANTTGADRITPFSQRHGELVPIFAPGALITGAAPGGGTSASSGTSQAAPHIAGIAVLAQQLAESALGRRLTTSEFISLMRETAVDIFDGDDEDDNVTNTGGIYKRVDVLALADKIVAMGGGGSTSSVEDIAPNTTTKSFISANSTFKSQLEKTDDVDYVRIWLSKGATYVFELNAAASGKGTLADPYLGLYNSSGGWVTGDDDAGTGFDSRIAFTATESAFYYLAVQSSGGKYQGSYELSVSNNAPPDEYRGDMTTTGKVNVGASTSGIINFEGDYDWFKVDLVEGTTYNFRLEGVTLADPYLSLFDRNGIAPIASNDDGGGGRNALIEYTATYTGAHYLSAEGYHTSVGAYRITVTQGEALSIDDVVLRDAGGAIGVFDFKQGGSFFFHTIQDNLGTNWKAQGIGNFAGRGNEDMILRDTNSGDLAYWHFDHAGQKYLTYVQKGLGTQWQVQGVGDFTNDGRDDILLRNVQTGAIGYFDFEPTGGFSWNMIQDNLGLQWQVKGVGDLNNNGFDDIILRDSNTGVIGYWKFQNGSREFVTIQDNLGTAWDVKGTGDFTNDGYDDIILYHSGTREAGFWDFADNSFSYYKFTSNLGANVVVQGTGDFYGDSHDDILVRNTVSGELGYWDFYTHNGAFAHDYTVVQKDLGLQWSVTGTGDLWSV